MIVKGLGKTGLLPPRKNIAKNSDRSIVDDEDDGKDKQETPSSNERSHPNLITEEAGTQATDTKTIQIHSPLKKDKSKSIPETGRKSPVITRKRSEPPGNDDVSRMNNKQHPATKQKKRKPSSQLDDVIGTTVQVPAEVFQIDSPGLYYIGDILRPDPRRKSTAVEVKFRDDDSLYWFPISDIRGWLADMKRRGAIVPSLRKKRRK